MHTGTLTGHVTGKNRQQLIDTATGEAVAYFNRPPGDIEIVLQNETTEGVDDRSWSDKSPVTAHIWYTADYQAWLKDKTKK